MTIAIPQHPFCRSDNPRLHGRCACGRPAEDHPAPDRERNPQGEAQFLKDALTLAQRNGWPVSVVWPRQVNDRLTMGQNDYGNRALYRDNLPDILEETPDLGSYPVLELQRLQYEGSDTYDEDRMDLLAIAAHATAQDWHARRIMRRRAGLE